jgi:hypothetical protein
VNIPAALAAYRQFVIYGADKLPRNPATGDPAGSTDPATWSDAATALAAVNRFGAEGVGFVFTETDPFFFLDVDHALEAGQWSGLAVQLCQAFAGCFVEVSRSGTGLHILGSGNTPAHGCRNQAHGLELYTEGRYVALTGRGATGDPGAPARPEVLDWLVGNFFPPRADAESADWTDGPVPEWNGPEDDGELIQRMLSAKGSAGAAFGGRATLRGLWEADDDELGRSYPDPRGFDRSSADAALCQHLAFWTGKDCERMDRIFRSSALYREKWERPDYRQRTILHAVGYCSTVYGSRTSPSAGVEIPESVEPAGTMQAAPAGLRDGFQFLAVAQQVQHFAGCVYIRSLHRAFTPDGALLKPEQFRATFGGYAFAMDLIADKMSKNAWEAFTESLGFCFPKVHAACFRPECPPGAIVAEEGQTMVNTYVPIPTPQQAGDPQPFLDHLARLLPVEGDRAILLSYMAAMVQFPGVKFQWMPLIQGMEGNGKTLLTTCLEHAIGKRYSHRPNASDISNKFNAWLIGKLFIGIEEIYVADRQEALDALKPLITNDRVDIQGKGDNQETGDNRANFLATSNHRDAVRKTLSDRRYCVFYTAQQEPGDIERAGMGGEYFPRLYSWLRAGGYAVVNNYLRTYAIPDALNPAGACHRAPQTSTTQEAIQNSLGGIEQEVMEAVEQGRAGFSGGWVSSLALDRLIDDRRIRMTPNKRRDLLRGLGYDPHPGLRDGRVNNMITDAGLVGKPRLYIREGHPAASLTNAAEITRHYQDAQAGGTLAGSAFSAQGAMV